MSGFSRLFRIVTVTAMAVAGAAVVQALRFEVANGTPGTVADAHVRPGGGESPNITGGDAVFAGDFGRVATSQHQSACLHDVETLFRLGPRTNDRERQTSNWANLCTMLRMSLVYAGPDRYDVGWHKGWTAGGLAAPAPVLRASPPERLRGLAADTSIEVEDGMAGVGADGPRGTPEEGARPWGFAVRLLDDDHTPMEFVVRVLRDVFGKSHDEAVALMLETHRQGRGTCGAYPRRDEADAKAREVADLARQRGHPLVCVVEEGG